MLRSSPTGAGRGGEKGRRSFVRGRQSGIIGAGRHPRQRGRAHWRTEDDVDCGVVSLYIRSDLSKVEAAPS